MMELRGPYANRLISIAPHQIVVVRHPSRSPLCLGTSLRQRSHSDPMIRIPIWQTSMANVRPCRSPTMNRRGHLTSGIPFLSPPNHTGGLGIFFPSGTQRSGTIRERPMPLLTLNLSSLLLLAHLLSSLLLFVFSLFSFTSFPLRRRICRPSVIACSVEDRRRQILREFSCKYTLKRSFSSFRGHLLPIGSVIPLFFAFSLHRSSS